MVTKVKICCFFTLVVKCSKNYTIQTFNKKLIILIKKEIWNFPLEYKNHSFIYIKNCFKVFWPGTKTSFFEAFDLVFVFMTAFRILFSLFAVFLDFFSGGSSLCWGTTTSLHSLSSFSCTWVSDTRISRTFRSSLDNFMLTGVWISLEVCRHCRSGDTFSSCRLY